MGPAHRPLARKTDTFHTHWTRAAHGPCPALPSSELISRCSPLKNRVEEARLDSIGSSIAILKQPPGRSGRPRRRRRQRGARAERAASGRRRSSPAGRGAARRCRPRPRAPIVSMNGKPVPRARTPLQSTRRRRERAARPTGRRTGIGTSCRGREFPAEAVAARSRRERAHPSSVQPPPAAPSSHAAAGGRPPSRSMPPAESAPLTRKLRRCGSTYGKGNRLDTAAP